MSDGKITIGEPVLTRYERARIVGARALQISHGAPLLIDVENDDFRPHDVANKELRGRTLPIGLSRRLPNGRSEVIPIQYLEDREFITQIKVKEPAKDLDRSSSYSAADLTEIPGVGDTTAEDFVDAGLTSVRDIASAKISELTKIKGIGKKTAEQIQSDAKDLLGEGNGSADLDLTEVTGIGASKADDLKAAGFKTVSQLANASVKDLTQISGIGKATAQKYIDAAKDML